MLQSQMRQQYREVLIILATHYLRVGRGYIKPQTPVPLSDPLIEADGWGGTPLMRTD
jgi:hypothetical protein